MKYLYLLYPKRFSITKLIFVCHASVDVGTYYASDVQTILQLQRHATSVEKLYQKIAFYNCSNNGYWRGFLEHAEILQEIPSLGYKKNTGYFEVMNKSHHRKLCLNHVSKKWWTDINMAKLSYRSAAFPKKRRQYQINGIVYL